jgi:hypothetical protein
MRINDITQDMLPLRDGLTLEGRSVEDVDEPWLRHCISDIGIAFVHSIKTPQAAKAVAELIGDIRTHRDANEDGVTVVAPNEVETGRTGLQGFSYQPLFPHTDRTIAALPPDLVFIWCEEASATGGVSLLVDASDVYRELCVSSPEIVEQLRQPDAAVFESDGAFIRSPVFFESELQSGRVCVRFRYDKLLYINCAYIAAIPILKATISAKATRVRLRPGQGYIVSNTRWLHGRSGFSGSRRFMRLLIDMRRPADPGFALHSIPWE